MFFYQKSNISFITHPRDLLCVTINCIKEFCVGLLGEGHKHLVESSLFHLCIRNIKIKLMVWTTMFLWRQDICLKENKKKKMRSVSERVTVVVDIPESRLLISTIIHPHTTSVRSLWVFSCRQDLQGWVGRKSCPLCKSQVLEVWFRVRSGTWFSEKIFRIVR